MAPNGVSNGFGVARQPDVHLVVRRPRSGTALRSCRLTPNPLQADDDAVYEQDIMRDPGSTKPWLAYIEFKLQHGTIYEQAFVLERACLQLPRSYKLWKMVSFALRRVRGTGD